jgi:hypothetical protein
LKKSAELAPTSDKPLVVVTGTQRTQINTLVSVVHDSPVVIRTADEYTAAGAQLVTIKQNLKQLDAVFNDISKPATEAIDKMKESMTKLKAFFSTPKQRLQAAETQIKSAMNAYLHAEEVRRLEQQKILDDAAAKEKARIKALADEAARKAAEEAAKVRRDAAAAAAAGRAAEAAKLAAKADKVDANASIRADIATAKISSLDAPVLTAVAPTAAGVGSRKVWVFEVEDASLVPDQYKVVSDPLIKEQVTAGVRSIPGVRIFEKQIITARTS